MSQGQSRRPQAGDQRESQPIKYEDVFNGTGELANKPIVPQDAAMMQAAETGVLGHNDITDMAGDQVVSFSETDVSGRRIITESVAGQVVGQYVQATPVPTTQIGVIQQTAITIGEALEATAQTTRDKPVDQSDAAAIQAAEVRATGSNVIIPGGLAATAQSAAAQNASVNRNEEKIRLNEVLTGATAKLPADKAVTRQDDEGVVSAELRNNPNVATRPGAVAASIAAAARLNENVNI
ncbi:PREDICTED: LOW QUALITY PROTEIN: late embryogenesis abundant protein D-34 [Theobroma cacao]|uniref:LOW QUALITY PROTEIN: late embryogenesis abundant protein D-34 n=1 Tax=Theobroma cacao TaxID=3641 RepID=A0AB32W9Y1_THECC|nr:PREDICTED: LOW QUALITY PROTEIN: late embryogenesis abundant protein D-34 [Theobroma cacao]